MAEFEQIESVQSTGGGEPPVKGLYEALKADKELGSVFGKYSQQQFEQKLKSDKNAASELRGIAISKGLYKTDKDFDAAIFGVKPAAPVKPAATVPAAPVAEKKPKEEKGFIRTAMTEGIPGVVAKLSTTPFGESLGQTLSQTSKITGEPVKKKEDAGIIYGKRTPLDDYEKIQQQYIDIDKVYVQANNKANPSGAATGRGVLPEPISPDLIKERESRRKKSDAILAQSSPEIDAWAESIIGNKDKNIPSKISLSLDKNEKVNLPRALYKNNAGNLTVDDALTDKFAKEEVRRRGLPENGVVYKLLKNALDRKIPYEIARPIIESEAERNFFKENGISITDAKAKDFTQQLGGTESEQRALNQATAKIGSQIVTERDAKIGEVTSRLKSLQEKQRKTMDEDQEGMGAYNAVRQDMFDQYQTLVNEGKLSAEKATEYINSKEVNDAANKARNEVLQKKYGSQMTKDYGDYLTAYSNINSRYKARYTRESDEAQAIANAQLDKRVAALKAKYKPSDAFIAKYKKAYKAASDKYFNQKEFEDVSREYGADAVDRITRSILSSFGDGIRGLGTSFNVPDAEQFGEVLASNFRGANIKIKEGAEGWKQALNPFDPAAQQSFGQLIGRMAPSLAASAAVGAASGGLGLGTLPSAIAAGFAGGVMETADITGSMYNDVLEQTGDYAKATQAANAAFKSQMQIAPVYALDAFAFFPKLFRGLKYGKSVIGRSVMGAGTEYATEMLQELPQNVYEELIRKGVAEDKPYDPSIGSMLANTTIERINETAKQLTGTLLLAGAPSLFSDAGENMNKMVAKRAAQAYYAKNVLTDASHPALILENQSQFLQKAFGSRGKNFANAMIGTFLINGNLTKEQAQALTNKMQNYEKFNNSIAAEKKANKGVSQLDNPLAKQGAFLLFDRFMTARASKNEEAAKAAYQKYLDFRTGKGGDLVLVRLADGTMSVYTYDDFDTLLDNPRMQDLVREQGFQLTPFSQDPNDAMVGALNQKLQAIAETPTTAQQDENFVAPDDNKILEAQQRTGYQVPSPLANLPQEINDALQAASENLEGFDPQMVNDASNYLYKLYNIAVAQLRSTTRNLTKEQISDQVKQLEAALDLLVNYQNRLATGEMEIEEGVQGEESTQQPPAPPAAPAPGTPQLSVMSDDEIIAQMTEEDKDRYYEALLDGSTREAASVIAAYRGRNVQAGAEANEVEEAANSVRESVKEAGIDVSLIETEEEYNRLVEQYGGRGQAASQGMFFGDDGKIFINRQRLDGGWGTTVIFHEGTHPVLNIIRNTNPDLYYKVLSGLKKLSEKNNALKAIYTKVSEVEVEQARIDDEFLTETIGQIGSGKFSLSDIPSTLRDALVEFINKMATIMRLPNIKVSDEVAFKKLAKDIASVLKGDKKLEELVGKENIREYKDNIGQGGQARSIEKSIGKDMSMEDKDYVFYNADENIKYEVGKNKPPKFVKNGVVDRLLLGALIKYHGAQRLMYSIKNFDGPIQFLKDINEQLNDNQIAELVGLLESQKEFFEVSDFKIEDSFEKLKESQKKYGNGFADFDEALAGMESVLDTAKGMEHKMMFSKLYEQYVNKAYEILWDKYVTNEQEAQKALPAKGQARSASFSKLDQALELSPVKSKEARAALADEFGKETIDKMIEITRNFEKIINGLEEEEVVKKDCP
jgi:hypothetical protein